MGGKSGHARGARGRGEEIVREYRTAVRVMQEVWDRVAGQCDAENGVGGIEEQKGNYAE